MVPYAKSEQTRGRLLASTAQLLRTQGYAATGLSAVVKASGVPKGSLYHHFPGGKEELAAASVALSGERILRALTAMADESGHPVTAMRAFCDYYVGQLEGSAFTRGCPLSTIALEASADVDAVHYACRRAFDGIVGLFAARLEEAGLEPERAHRSALMTVSAIEGALILAKASRDAGVLRTVRDELTRQLQAELSAVAPSGRQRKGDR